MAHKHNRRRARPRSRQNKNRKESSSSETSYNSGFSYDSLSYPPQIYLTPPQFTYAIPATHPQFYPNYTTGANIWYGHPEVQHVPDQIAPKDAISVESQRLKMFGGVPGDDVDLCYKMIEVFEGMDWIKP